MFCCGGGGSDSHALTKSQEMLKRASWLDGPPSSHGRRTKKKAYDRSFVANAPHRRQLQSASSHSQSALSEHESLDGCDYDEFGFSYASELFAALQKEKEKKKWSDIENRRFFESNMRKFKTVKQWPSDILKKACRNGIPYERRKLVWTELLGVGKMQGRRMKEFLSSSARGSAAPITASSSASVKSSLSSWSPF